jgi:hypothetical protein
LRIKPSLGERNPQLKLITLPCLGPFVFKKKKRAPEAVFKNYKNGRESTQTTGPKRVVEASDDDGEEEDSVMKKDSN